MTELDRAVQLEADLRALGRALAVPPTPALGAAVRRRISTAPRPGLAERLFGRPSWRSLVAAVAVLLVVLGGALAIPPVRSGLARLLHIPGVDIQRAPHPLPSVSPSPGGPASLGLGDRSSLAAARALAGFTPRIPQALGDPDQVYVLRGTYGTAVTLVYLPRPGLPEVRKTGVGLLLTEVRGSIDRPLLGKVAGPDTTVTEVRVGPAPGFWLAGAPHEVGIQVGQDIHTEPLRLAGDALVWGDGTRVWRLESGLDQQAAIKVAESLR
jgi:hypothetical protein